MTGKSGKTIVILGGSIMQIPALKTARELGWNVVLMDGDAEAIGKEYADHFEQIDLKEKERIEQAVRSFSRKKNVDGVFTSGTDFSTTVAWVAERLGLPGISYETALNATDKERMRTVFKKYNVPSPGFTAVSRVGDADKVLSFLSFPLVVKPADNMGARGVKRVDTAAGLKEALAAALAFSRSKRVIVEEYVAGPEFSLDAIVHEGRISICGIADRHICFPPFFVEMGHTMPTDRDAETIDRIVAVFKKGVQALGIKQGAAKGDVKLSPSGPVIGEIAARLSGGYMSGWTYPYASGVEVTRAALFIAIGMPPSSLRPRHAYTSAERAFISIPGQIRQICGVNEAKNTDRVMDIFLRVAEGSKVSFPRNNVEKCGNVITRAPDRAEAVGRAEQAIQEIFLRLEPGRTETDRFLFHDSQDSARCFSLTDHKNLQALTAMKPQWGKPQKNKTQKIFIKSLPFIGEEKAGDWHGLGMQAALEKVCRYSGVQLKESISDNDIVLGSTFWQAFLKGGTQGGIYVIDTLLKPKDG